jgi:hypothetical protein
LKTFNSTKVTLSKNPTRSKEVDVPTIFGGVVSGEEMCRAVEVRPKTLWSFWHEGEEKLPPFYAMCVKSWRNHLKVGGMESDRSSDWDIRILNLVEGHPDNVLRFVSLTSLPNRFFSIALRQHQVLVHL